ncbi:MULTISPECIES: hypothetical protein [Marinobacter]|uniref:hypothetical protein n=1 Tax=Marinobacter TaxID=2742 RepID=UPI0012479DCB|nr:MULTISPECIES: hypothetical protein [Marinobacter]MBL3557607.1 hypothetical protein [Marinobacter sp. JB05H06]
MNDIGLSAKSYVIDLAAQHGIRYQETPADRLAVVATRLAGDEVVTDEIEDLIVALKRAQLITGTQMVELLGRYLDETLPVTSRGKPENDAIPGDVLE